MKKPKDHVPFSEKCKEPKMTDHAGAKWNSCTVIDLKGTKSKGYFDAERSTYFYFQFDGHWRKARQDRFMKIEKPFIADFSKPL